MSYIVFASQEATNTGINSAPKCQFSVAISARYWKNSLKTGGISRICASYLCSTQKNDPNVASARFHVASQSVEG